MEMINTDEKHHAYFRLETLKEQIQKLLKEASILSNRNKETATSGSIEEPFQVTIQKEGVCKALKPPRPPPRKPKVEQTSGIGDPIYSNHYNPRVNDSVKLNLLSDKYVELEHEMTNLTEMIKAEVNCSSSNENYQAASTIQQNGQCNAPPQLVGALPHSVNKWEEQKKVLRKTQNGGLNENSFYPYYFSDPNNDPYYRTFPRKTMTVEILQKQLKEALKLIEITIKSSQNILASPNVVNKYTGYVPIPAPRENSQRMSKLENKPQNFEEAMSSYCKRAPPPIPRQHLQTFSKLEIHGNTSEELEQEEGECLKEPVYGNTRQPVWNDKEMSSNDDVYTFKQDDPYYSSVPMTDSSLTEDELENLRREAKMLNMRVDTVVKNNNGSLGPSLRKNYNSCNLEKETDFKCSSQELLQEDEQAQPETEHLKAMLNQALAENDSLKMSLQQAKDELERRMVLSNIPDELQVNTLFLSILKDFISTKISYLLPYRIGTIE